MTTKRRYPNGVGCSPGSQASRSPFSGSSSSPPRDWRWASVQAVLVIIWFGDLIRFGAVLTWPYLVTLGLALVTAVVGFADLLRFRPQTGGVQDQPSPAAIRVLGVVFVILVGFLAVKGLLDPASGRSLNVFPKRCRPSRSARSPFSTAPSLWAPSRSSSAGSLTPTITYALAGIGLIVPITVAAVPGYRGRDGSVDVNGPLATPGSARICLSGPGA